MVSRTKTSNLISINKSWYSCIYFFSSVISICLTPAFVLEKMLVKSIMGYALAPLFVGYGAWIVISKFINEKYDIVKHPTAWRVGQWFTTLFLMVYLVVA